MKTKLMIVIAASSFSVVLPTPLLIAAEVMPNDPVLPQNNLPTNQRQGAASGSDITNSNQLPVRRSNGNSSTNTSTGIDIGPGTQITPKAGTQNGTLTGNGAGVGPESSSPSSPNTR